MTAHRARVLVIDDDPLFRSLIVSLLRKEFLVSVAADGSEGLYKALEQPPEIAVIDIRMPGWDGLTTLKAFRSHPSLQNVKAVILTADASRQTVLAAIDGGADDYVVKTNFAREDFLGKLERLLSRDAPARPVSAASPEARATDAPPLAAGPAAAPLIPADECPTESVAVNPGAAKSLAATPAGGLESEALQEIIDSWE